MSAGLRVPYDATYLTKRHLYRELSVADANGADGPGPFGEVIPIINLHVDLQSGPRKTADGAVEYPPAMRGYNGVLMIYAALREGASQAKISLWVWGGAEPYPTTDAAMVDQWCLVDRFEITESTLLPFPNIPAAPYRILVDQIDSGSGTSEASETSEEPVGAYIQLVVQHTV